MITMIPVETKHGVITVHFPTHEDLASLKVGDRAPSSLGPEAEVTEIFASGTDINGKFYVCYYTRFGENGSVSTSLKEGEIPRTVDLCRAFTSAEIDAMQMNARRGLEIKESSTRKVVAAITLKSREDGRKVQINGTKIDNGWAGQTAGMEAAGSGPVIFPYFAWEFDHKHNFSLDSDDTLVCACGERRSLG